MKTSKYRHFLAAFLALQATVAFAETSDQKRDRLWREIDQLIVTTDRIMKLGVGNNDITRDEYARYIVLRDNCKKTPRVASECALMGSYSQSVFKLANQRSSSH